MEESTQQRRQSAKRSQTAKATAVPPPWPPLLAGTLLVGCCLVAYANSFTGVFLFDDIDNIVNNPSITSFERLWTMEPARGLHRREVVSATLAWNYRLGKLDPWGYHAVNLLIHIVAALLLWGLLRRTLRLPGIPPALVEQAEGLALAAAVLWAVHPLQTESVTYVIQRCESLMGMFYLATLYCALRAATSARPAPWGAAAIVFCSLGMGSKEVMITAPLVVLLFDRAFLADSWRTVIRKRWWMYVGFAPAALWLLSAAGLLPQFGAAPVPMIPPPTAAVAGTSENNAQPTETHASVALGKSDLYFNRLEYLRTQPQVVLHYLRLCFVPAGQCLDYLWPAERDPGRILLTSLAVIGLMAASVWAWFRHPRLGLLGLAFFLILTPTSSVISLNLAYEHRMYLPLACVICGTLVALQVVLDRWSPGLTVRRQRLAVAAIVAVLMGATFARNTVYSSTYAMWSDVIAKAPHNPRAYNGYGRALLLDGRHEEAEPYFHHALELMPYFWSAHLNLAELARRRGDQQTALQHTTIAYRLRPHNIQHQVLLVEAANNAGEHADAERLARAFLDKHPEEAALLYELGSALVSQGRLAESDEHLGAVSRRRPHDARLHFLRGLVAQEGEDWNAAAQHYQAALELVPNHAKAHNNVGWIFQRQGDQDTALRHFRQSMAADPLLPEPYLNAGKLLLARGQVDEAIAHLTKAVKLSPQLTSAHDALMRARQERVPTRKKALPQALPVASPSLLDKDAR